MFAITLMKAFKLISICWKAPPTKEQTLKGAS